MPVQLIDEVMTPSTTPSNQQFDAIVIDPPWRYGNERTRGAAVKHYPTMSLDEIEALPVDRIAKADAHLYLWTTNAFLPAAIALVEKWNFRYVLPLTWVKDRFGLGNYFRNSTEHVIFAVRGRAPVLRRNIPTHFCAPRQAHSRKPDVFYQLVDAASAGSKLELFARGPGRASWATWGNEATHSAQLTALEPYYVKGF